jgi:hypothetical protein
MKTLRMGIVICLLWHGPCAAAGFGFSFGGANGDYSYANEPMYQYPRTDGKGVRCPKGQMPYQGKCRTARWFPGGTPYDPQAANSGSQSRF